MALSRAGHLVGERRDPFGGGSFARSDEEQTHLTGAGGAGERERCPRTCRAKPKEHAAGGKAATADDGEQERGPEHAGLRAWGRVMQAQGPAREECRDGRDSHADCLGASAAAMTTSNASTPR